LELKAEESASTLVGQNSTQKPQDLQRSTADAVRQAVADSVPPSFRGLNLKAFEKGFDYGSSASAARLNIAELDTHAVYSQEHR